MATRLKIVDRDTPMMLPPDIREWIPEDHIVRFIIEAVSLLGLKGFKVNTRGSGSEQYSLKIKFRRNFIFYKALISPEAGNLC